MAVDPACIAIDLTGDKEFDAFTLQTLQERYMLPGEASPQQAFARAAAAFADDEAHAQRVYDYVRKGWFMFATPVLANGGATRGLPISCFLTYVDDSRESIFEHWTEIGWLSSEGGGVSSYHGLLRTHGESTSRGSSSNGAIPFICVDDRVILAVNQGGTRRGSDAIYMDITHPEVEEFIGIRKSTGDENRKAPNLHNAVNITDAFMVAVRDDTTFDLRDPHSGKVTKVVRARDLWKLIIETRIQTGEPYLHFIDESNRRLPAAQRARGLKVNQSNLCVTSDTEVLTKQGYLPIGFLEGREVEVWNGEAWSVVSVRRTNDKAELVRVHFEDGEYIDCTPYHKFYLTDGTVLRAIDLKAGVKLEKPNHPIMGQGADVYGVDRAYTAGWATFAGAEDTNRLAVYAPASAGDRVTKRLLACSIDPQADQDGMLIRYEPRTIPSGAAPVTWGLEDRRAWLAGALDAVGEWVTLGQHLWLGLSTPDEQLIREMRRVALECGMKPRVRLTSKGAGFAIDAVDAGKLMDDGLLLRHEPPFAIREEGVPTVVGVTPVPYQAATYCFTENVRGRAIFNGVLTGNCTEITLPTGIDEHGRRRTAVCCLSSVNAETFEEWRDHPTFIEDLMRMLDNVLTFFISTAPPALAAAVWSASQERAVGLGCLGFHAYLQKNDVAFESEDARRLNMDLFKHIRRQADAASLKLGAERGEAPDMAGTGERFSHKMAIAPNASSAILCRNTSPSIEPRPSNVYLHKTLSGSFAVRNPYLVARLDSLGLNTQDIWRSIIKNEGSVQHLAELDDHTKRVFRTAFELDQRWIVRHAADRGFDICQAQSVNVFFPPTADAGVISEAHFLGWELKLKSFYYLRSKTAKRAENTNSVVERKVVSADAENALRSENGLESEDDLGSLVAAAGIVVKDEDCFGCQG